MSSHNTIDLHTIILELISKINLALDVLDNKINLLLNPITPEPLKVYNKETKNKDKENKEKKEKKEKKDNENKEKKEKKDNEKKEKKEKKDKDSKSGGATAVLNGSNYEELTYLPKLFNIESTKFKFGKGKTDIHYIYTINNIQYRILYKNGFHKYLKKEFNTLHENKMEPDEAIVDDITRLFI